VISALAGAFSSFMLLYKTNHKLQTFVVFCFYIVFIIATAAFYAVKNVPKEEDELVYIVKKAKIEKELIEKVRKDKLSPNDLRRAFKKEKTKGKLKVITENDLELGDS